MSKIVPGSDQADGGTAGHAPIEHTNSDFESIYRAETSWLIRFFRRRLSNAHDAQDLAQETILRFMRIAPSVQLATPQAYLRRIATNLARDHIGSGAERLARRSAPLIDGLDAAVGVDQHQIVASREELAAWEAILSKLKPRTLEIFLLSRVDGLTYLEIANHLDMTIWNVKKHMRKAIQHVEWHRRVR
ncbi:RNA polymerase sigma factor [Sphingomonas oryzagri]